MGVEIGAFDSGIQSHRSTTTGAVRRDNADILEIPRSCGRRSVPRCFFLLSRLGPPVTSCQRDSGAFFLRVYPCLPGSENLFLSGRKEIFLGFNGATGASRGMMSSLRPLSQPKASYSIMISSFRNRSCKPLAGSNWLPDKL